MTSADTMEIAVLGAAMKRPAILDSIGSQLSPNDFSDPHLGEVFAVMVAMRAGGRSVDDVGVLTASLNLAGLLHRVGGPETLATWLRACETPDRADQYARLVREKAHRGRFVQLGNQILTKAADARTEPPRLADWVETQLGNFRGAFLDEARSLHELCGEVLDASDAALLNGLPIGLKTGIAPLDDFVTLRPGDVCIVAGRPSSGKSVLVSQIARYNGESRQQTLLVSLEMDSSSLAVRHLSAKTGVEPSQIINGEFSVGASKNLRAAAAVTPTEIAIWHGRSVSVEQIRSLAKLQAATCGLDLLVVDYLGLIESSDPRKPRWEAVGEISRQIKSLALEMRIPVVVACQLGRDAEFREPNLAHLRDSGSVEQDADQVILISRTRGEPKTLVQVAKNRNGQVGTLELQFDDETLTFTSDDCPDISSIADQFDNATQQPTGPDAGHCDKCGEELELLQDVSGTWAASCTTCESSRALGTADAERAERLKDPSRKAPTPHANDWAWNWDNESMDCQGGECECGDCVWDEIDNCHRHYLNYQLSAGPFADDFVERVRDHNYLATLALGQLADDGDYCDADRIAAKKMIADIYGGRALCVLWPTSNALVAGAAG